MSYDLYFRTRGASLDPVKIEEYFRGRPNYLPEHPEYMYFNGETGVYFQFTMNDPDPSLPDTEAEAAEDEGFAASFTINFVRASFFILEAEPEIAAFVQAFDLTVCDEQIDGMGEGEYERDKLIAGWDKGNAFGYHAVLNSDESTSPTPTTLPRDVLVDAWRWNFGRTALQTKLGENVFVPLKVFLRISGQPRTVAAWPDVIPIAITKVDCFLVAREQLAPRKFLFRKKDSVFLTWEQMLPWLEKYRSRQHADLVVLDYASAPADFAEFISALPAESPEVEGIPFDQILDRELVEENLSKRTGG